MNYRAVLHILAIVLWVLAGAQLAPLTVALIYGEEEAIRGFLAGAAATAALGALFRLLGQRSTELFRREGVLIVVAVWVLASLSGAIPYVVDGAIPGLADAAFESASGFTTTGASVLQDIESHRRSILFWRSLTQWLGGIGIVVLLVALLAELGPGTRFLFKLEVPGPRAEIFHARVQESALSLARIYTFLSASMVVALLACGLSLYDALTHTFSTVSTGGFSTYNASIGHFSPAVQWIVLVFMLASGVNFSLYFTLLRSRRMTVLRDAELRLYLAIVAIAGAAIAMDRYLHAPDTASLRDALFQVVSVVTTTGFATADFGGWPPISEACLVALMIVGGCAGSTAGGAKVVRMLVGFRATMRDVRLTFSPNSVIAIAVGGATLPNESVRAVLSFLVLYAASWGAGTLLLSIGDHDLVTSASASIAALSNVGPGLGLVGPAENYAFFAGWQKLLLVGLMWLGRLELFTVLALFQRRFWQR